MLTKEIIYTVEIPEYIREVELSKKQRPRYLELQGTNPQFWKVPPRYIRKEYKSAANKCFHINHLKDQYIVAGFRKNKYCYSLIIPLDFQDIEPDDKLYMCEIVNMQIERVIVNTIKVGTPRIMRINAQDFYAGFASPHMRGKIINDIKLNMLEHVRNLPVIGNYPVRIELEIQDTVKNYTDRSNEGDGTRWDLDNRAYPYFKSFLDLLVTGTIDSVKYFEPKLVDDDRLHVTGSGGAYFTPIEDFAQRKLRFHIYKDLRPIITSNKHYNNNGEDKTNTIPEKQPW